MGSSNWQDYENEIFKHFKTEFPSPLFKITQDARVTGRFSKVERQIDILIEGTTAGFEHKIAIDAKSYNKPIDVIGVEAFIEFCKDIHVHTGVLISPNGYTPAAKSRAYNYDGDIELDIFNNEDLKHYQGFCAIPYAGNHGLVIGAPFGWVIDAAKHFPDQPFQASIYQRGFDFENALDSREWMYLTFWKKDKTASTLEELLNYQETYMKEAHPDWPIYYQEGPRRGIGRTQIRIYDRLPVPEYTGFIEFDDFIAFCVLLTPIEVAKRNLRKLNYILKTAIPLKVDHVPPKTP